MVHEVQMGTRKRMSFSRINEVLDMPDLIEVQKNSYKRFVEEDLREVLDDISPITDYTEKLVLEFVDYSIDFDHPKYSVEECKERDVNYCAPLKVLVRLINKETGEVKEQPVFMGDFPLMTEQGTFIINGAERVIVSQLVRSPGVYYTRSIDKLGKNLYSAQVIPNRGAWLEYETDSSEVLHVKIDRQRKVYITALLRALGYGTNAEIIELMGEEERLMNTLDKDTTKSVEDGLIEIYKRQRPGEPPTEESARSLLNALFFDRRYDLARVGRYKFNKKLSLAARIAGQISADDVIDPATGEIIVEAGKRISAEAAERIENTGVRGIFVTAEDKRIKVLGNLFVDAKHFLSFNPEEAGLNERVHYPTLMQLLKEGEGMDEEELKALLKEHVYDLIPRHILPDDMIASISYLIGMNYGIGRTDDIDHLGNRRIRSVGELLQNQIRVGMTRLERVVRERMSIQDMETAMPSNLINIRPVTAAIKEFFGSSQLSQFMDQTNPLAELTHKRRLSALGPGGLNRDRATFDVRDVHYSHYGRMCPIETPEGPNIGLINSLSTYARINKYGFIEAPYRKVDGKNHSISSDIVYLTADEEDDFIVAQANEATVTTEEGNTWFAKDHVVARWLDKIIEVPAEQVHYMDVSPKQLVSVATAMIPFLENDDANRALMGSNMQRQAVPLLMPEAPVVGTGMEYKAAHDSGVVVVAHEDATVIYVAADKVVTEDASGIRHTYKLIKFKRSNQGTCINQRPIVNVGDKVKVGDVLADGASTEHGEIALGRNILIGFMTWEGYNYEDAVLISEKLVKDDVYTSIHIEEHETEARDTKLGKEEITRDIPNVGEDALSDLDERGIIRIGAEVRSGDILVGKVTPKGETELTAEERLLRAIFGEKAREVRDTSLRVPHGEGGVIVDVKIFTRENKDELAPGVNELVRVYIAQKRKISVGDKMAGRHGNKGVISRILPEEDMPFLPDGTPLQIVLNPLGVPSRMNIGQVLELHLGMAAKTLGWHIATPVFDGASEQDIKDLLVKAGKDPDGKTVLYDGRTGEPFENRVSVGYMYYLKLHHLVDDKIHARSTGPYSLVTQQPLGGKAQFGGQRFGEMEVWALEAYGAANTLQEILTVKSDDIVGRVKTYEAIVKGENVPEPGVPESFKVLIKELQSLGLDIKVLSDTNEEIQIGEMIDDDDTTPIDVNMSGLEDVPDMAPMENDDRFSEFDFNDDDDDDSDADFSEFDGE
ncbi:MAG: DNA-directed RNA polymerase subunit beta [Eubacteriales bacterium]|jgi:DNA-directed RNA polymerase subunit beta|nr:DNA-directed RNA polymerase subunit beta [Christensenellaceae bacterium]MDY2747831.1 DNA-directed RNA polymerase subunit beta [Eubacteriales bacterium]CCX50286.1 dNA-directed RNA polymerase subunit beta [Clostridium sp. CAG:226]MDD6937770.1 DNA-directed RNA polymerase subunit beta [Christensenellaceae bacterium]MDD7495668.1 DNA-directed RNA polymerase subunit beta [Christensenellaceae bacterium]